MHISSLRLKNFRNLNLSYTPDQQFNFVVGANGAGKSNLLDSIHYLAKGKSFKKYVEGSNIAWEKADAFASILSQLQVGEDSRELEIIFAQQASNNAQIYKQQQKKTQRHKFVNQLRVIVFSPHSLDMIAAEPQVRRSEIDSFIETVDQNFETLSNEYKYVLKSRNKLLQQMGSRSYKNNEVSFWNERLVKTGSEIVRRRVELIARLQPYIASTASKYFSGQLQEIAIEYLPSFALGDDIAQSFAHSLATNIDRELRIFKTLFGPHRDDFEVKFSGKSMKVYASRGQQRMAAMLIKLAMWFYLFDIASEAPVLILDDVFSELDATNSIKLEKLLQKVPAQSFISSAHQNSFSQSFLRKGKLLRLGE